MNLSGDYWLPLPPAFPVQCRLIGSVPPASLRRLKQLAASVPVLARRGPRGPRIARIRGWRGYSHGFFYLVFVYRVSSWTYQLPIPGSTRASCWGSCRKIESGWSIRMYGSNSIQIICMLYGSLMLFGSTP